MTVLFSDLRCREVINLSDGCRLGYVSDLELNQETGQILTLIVPVEGKLMGLLPGQGEYVIPWSCIRRIGADLILVEICLTDVRRKKEKSRANR